MATEQNNLEIQKQFLTRDEVSHLIQQHLSTYVGFPRISAGKSGLISGSKFQTHAGSQEGIKIFSEDYATVAAQGYIELWDTAGNPVRIYLKKSSSGEMYLEGAHWIPDTDSAKDLGTTALRWRTIYVDDIVGGNDYAAGDLILHAHDIQVEDSTSGSLTKQKEVKVGKAGTLRIKFTLEAAGGGSNEVRGQIFRNGSAVGTLRETNNTTGVEYSEDISGWAAGDLCQLYAFKTTDTSVKVRNFRIYADERTAVYANDSKAKDVYGMRYIEIAPSTHAVSSVDTWEDWDLSSVIPKGARFAEIQMVRPASANEVGGIRKNGSSLERRTSGTSNTLNRTGMLTVELDSGAVIEVYASSTTLVEFVAWGYWI